MRMIEWTDQQQNKKWIEEGKDLFNQIVDAYDLGELNFSLPSEFTYKGNKVLGKAVQLKKFWLYILTQPGKAMLGGCFTVFNDIPIIILFEDDLENPFINEDDKKSTFVHEYVHYCQYIDNKLSTSTRISAKNQDNFDNQDLIDYYNSPHELQAYYCEGLLRLTTAMQTWSKDQLAKIQSWHPSKVADRYIYGYPIFNSVFLKNITPKNKALLKKHLTIFIKKQIFKHLDNPGFLIKLSQFLSKYTTQKAYKTNAN